MFASRKTFDHGVHPPEVKETGAHPIRRFPFAPLLIIPLSQHIGAPAEPVVREGQEVRRGERIAKPGGFVSVPYHAPATGIVRKVGPVPTCSGRMMQGIYIEPYPASGQQPVRGRGLDPKRATAEKIVDAIRDCGMVGLGGAGFPSHVKYRILNKKDPKKNIRKGTWIDTIIINGAECEPFLTADHRVMLERGPDIFTGIRFLYQAIYQQLAEMLRLKNDPKAEIEIDYPQTGNNRAEPKDIKDIEVRVFIGVENNKMDAVAALNAARPKDFPVTVEAVKVKYPQGAEKMLIYSLTGRKVPPGKLPPDVGVICSNVATVAELGRLLPRGEGLVERVLTVSGPAVREKGNYLVPIGTPLRFLLDHVELEPNAGSVLLGGPMMGPSAGDMDVAVTKGTSGIVVLTDRNTPEKRPCIGCGYCLDACPMFLNPSRLGRLAAFRQYEPMASDYNLMDCFECGCCSFVCPAHIPLVQQFRVAKSVLREKKVLEKKVSV